MKKNLKTFLKELANSSELKGNRYAWTIANHYSQAISSREKLYENIAPYYPPKDRELQPFEIEPSKEEIEIENFENKDFRIKSLKLAGTRFFPNSEKPFGIDFVKNDQPSNAIILGTNASGKSSIFDAIEYTFCQKIGEAELRTFEENDSGSSYFKNYLTHFNQDFNSVNCIVDTVDKELDIHGKVPFPKEIYNKINPNTHFISEYDIISLGKYEYDGSNERSFHSLIANSLGLQDYLEFSSLLSQFISYNRLKEKSAVSNLKKSIDDFEKSKDLYKKELDLRNEQIQYLTQQPNTSLSINTDQYKQILSKAKTNDISFSIDPIFLKHKIEEFSLKYEELKGIDISLSEQNEIEFLNLGIQILAETRDCPFCQNSKDEVLTIKMNVQNRIDKIKKYTDTYKKLVGLYIEVVEIFNDFKRKIIRINDYISKEDEEIKSVPDMSVLLSENLTFLQIIKEIKDNLFLEIEYSEKPILTSFEHLFKVVKENDSFYNETFMQFLSSIELYRQKRATLLIEVEKSISLKSNELGIIEKKAILEKEIREFTLQLEKVEENIIKNTEELNKAQIIYQQYLDIKDDVKKYIPFIKAAIDKHVNEAFDSIEDILLKIMNEYLKNEIERDKIALVLEKDPIVDEETGEITSEILAIRLNHPEKGKLSPSKYFNAFRYKLFAMAVGLSVAIASRRETKVNMPFVWDDIFYASDFERRLTVENFIKTIFKIFETYSKDIPVQLILFTHDELIYNSILNALIDINKAEETIFARLLPHNDNENRNNYLELTYRMPDKLPQYVLDELNATN